jgi:SAM-dependent methyltransferase
MEFRHAATGQRRRQRRAPDMLDVNYRFWIEYVAARRPCVVLDFGCGNGAVVAALRAVGTDCYGTDTFYEGMEFDAAKLGAMVQARVIRPHPEGRPLPFADDTFDLIISNMVGEHIKDLQHTAAELDRVLKPGGMMRHHFPSAEVLREGHIGIPLVHRLRPGRLRTNYTLFLRTIGLGYHRTSPAREWTTNNLAWLDRHCFYRPYGEIAHAFGAFEIQAREADYCQFRAEGRWFRPLLDRFEPLQTILLRRLAFMALEMRRPSSAHSPRRMEASRGAHASSE